MKIHQPCKVIKFGLSDCEKYLGLHIVEGTVKEIIDKNIEMKYQKLLETVMEIRQLLNQPGIRRLGLVQAQKTMAGVLRRNWQISV